MVTPAQVAEKYLAMPSSKHSGKRSRTQMLTVHSAESPLRRGFAKSLTNWSNTTGVQASWNAFADPGVVVRAVHTAYAAWHASWANPISIGYETAAYAAFSRADWLTLEGRRMLERLAIEMAADAEIFDIPLRWLTGRQVNLIRAGNTSIKGLSAHRQIDPAYRTDPGDGFPYGYLLKRIKHHSGVKPASNKPKPIQKDELEMANLNTVTEAVIKAGPKLADIILDSPVQIRGDGASGKTTLRKKIAYLFHEQNRSYKAIQAVNAKVNKLTLEHAGIKAAVQAVDDSAGIEGARLEEIVGDRVDAALADVTLTLTNDES